MRVPKPETALIPDFEKKVEAICRETVGQNVTAFAGVPSWNLVMLRKVLEFTGKIDTAPIGMVTDTLLIGRVADLSAYVCRADYTHKAEYTLINELFHEQKLPNLCTIINGVDLKKRKYGYYYGYGKYGKHYGYGKRYGYGYGYGQEK